MSDLDEIIEQFYRNYETDMAAVLPPIGLVTDVKEQNRQSEHFWNKRMREAKTAICDYFLKEVIGDDYVFERLKDDYLPNTYIHLKAKNELRAEQRSIIEQIKKGER